MNLGLFLNPNHGHCLYLETVRDWIENETKQAKQQAGLV